MKLFCVNILWLKQKFFFWWVILAIGLFGNISGLLVLKEKKLNKLGPLFMYRLMFIFDLIFLSGILVFIFKNFFQLNLSLISDLSCKLYFYFSYNLSYEPDPKNYTNRISLSRWIDENENLQKEAIILIKLTHKKSTHYTLTYIHSRTCK